MLDELASHSKADETFLITSSYLLELANRAYDLFMSSQPAQKNKILKMILANLELKDEKLVWKLKIFFEGVLNCNERKEWLPEHLDIKAVVLDTNYCEKLRYKLKQLMNLVKIADFGLSF